jgi:hypothetical protein
MSERPYVDLHEAIRVVVRLMPDGDALATKITNQWIIEGCGRFDAPDDAPDDFMVRVYGPNWQSGPDWESVPPRVIAAYDAAVGLTVRMYGPEWRSMQPRVIAAFREAERLLHQILPTGRVEGYGASNAAPNENRKIAQHEWSSLRPNIPRGILEAAHLPTIHRLLINREDLIREATVLLAPPKWGSNSYKRDAVGRAIDKLTVPVLARKSQDERERAVIDLVEKDNGGLKVSDRYVRQRWGSRNG